MQACRDQARNTSILCLNYCGWECAAPFKLILSCASFQGVSQLFGTLNFLRDILPPDVLAWKLDLVKQGVEEVDKILVKVRSGLGKNP